MSYSCYSRCQGDGLIQVTPIVTIRFDDMHAITRNRVRRYLQDNYCPTSWASKATAVIQALRGHHRVYENILHPDIIKAAGDVFEELEASLRLIDFSIFRHEQAHNYWYGYGSLRYAGERLSDDPHRKEQAEMARELVDTRMIPFARELADKTTQTAVLQHLEDRMPYTFEGVPQR